MRCDDTIHSTTFNAFTPFTLSSTSGGHTNTERGYLPILASKLRTTLAEFARSDVGPTDQRGEVISLTEEDRRLLESVEVVVCGEDKHPLKRM